ncbi:hypothetical protein MRX96_028696 [Rhipicephalus microplus]
MLLRLLSAACLVAAAAVASPRPPEEEAFEADHKSPLDAPPRQEERRRFLDGMTVSGVVKQLYSALYSSIKRKVAGEQGLSPMALEAIQELCLGGAGPAYQLVPPSRLAPSCGFRPVAETWTRASPCPPKMTLVEALRRADYKLAADTGRGSGVLHLGFSATRACYIVESVAGVRASPERAWKITIVDRFGKLVYDNICLPLKDDDLVVQPRMKITLTYVETKRKTQ